MLLIVRHKIVRQTGKRLGNNTGIGRVLYDRGGADLLFLGRRRPHLCSRLVQQARQQRQQIGRLTLEYLIGLPQDRRPDPKLNRAGFAQLQDCARPARR